MTQFKIYIGNLINGRGTIYTYRHDALDIDGMYFKTNKTLTISKVKLEKKINSNGISTGTLKENGREFFVQFKDGREIIELRLILFISYIY